jgi:hypothetical protein
MTERDDEEQELRINQMTINIEEMRADMKWETRKSVVSLLLATAVAVGAGAALGNYVATRPTPAPTIVQYVLPPGTYTVPK